MAKFHASSFINYPLLGLSGIKNYLFMWYKMLQIKEWFGEMLERHKLVQDFNKASKIAFVSGYAPTLLEARITRGENAYRHAFSKFMAGGFRIKALSGVALSRFEMQELAKVILDNDELVRRLISLGWDTLEVHDSKGFNGLRWPLKNYARIGGLLNSNHS